MLQPSKSGALGKSVKQPKQNPEVLMCIKAEGGPEVYKMVKNLFQVPLGLWYAISALNSYNCGKSYEKYNIAEDSVQRASSNFTKYVFT